jgi:demethylmenaquinone methyltransferase/2-methoxy-6-polyprenyl-1,4-benzoquinol methylase
MPTPPEQFPAHNQTRAAYDRLSTIYDWLAASEKPFRRRAVELLSAQPGERVLEIGCGTGESLATMLRAGIQPVGIDLSPGMLGQARKKMFHSQRAYLSTADALHLPFSENSFDAILMIFTLELFTDPEIPQALGEIQRLLKPSGRLCAAALAQVAHPGWMARAYTWFHQRYPQWVDCRPIPAQALITQSGLAVQEQWRGLLWGLPVEIVVAVQ